ncbi:hypothetical protein [Actinoallomurus soli]|uniref:hypothetical protein n=1 Tax=Actinoallomurus soli TaxID=2952535 RepID=UPI002093AAA9|nr:hypothetical protein [Actinoallomurus soli]MCO5970755.1 hypothetical protein [Actinoallomurus soli]
MSARPTGAVRRPPSLGDFTVGPRMLVVTLWALPVGGVAALAALGLLRLVALITDLVFYGHPGTRAPGCWPPACTRTPGGCSCPPRSPAVSSWA